MAYGAWLALATFDSCQVPHTNRSQEILDSDDALLARCPFNDYVPAFQFELNYRQLLTFG